MKGDEEANKETNNSERNRTALSVTNFLPSFIAANNCRWPMHADRSLSGIEKSDKRISICLLCVQTNKILEDQNEKI
jgi:hypothetical protein